MKKSAILLVFLVLGQLTEAEGLSVAYLEGLVQVQRGLGWTTLAIGDAVPVDSIIRVTGNGLVQINGAGVGLTLTRPGTYVVRDVLAARRALSSPGVVDAVVTSLRYLTFGLTGTQSSSMGARGANESKSDEEGWTESSAQVFLAAGREYVKAGKYDKAIAQFNEALRVATEQEQPEVHYYLGYAASLNGDVKEAWKQVAGLQPTTSDVWAGDFVLLKAKLLEDTSAFSEAVVWLLRNDLSEDAQRASLYYFLLGLGYRGAGKGENARQELLKVVTISAESDLGKAASELLQHP